MILEKLAEFILAYDLDKLSQPALDTGKKDFADTYGCLVAGVHESVPRIGLEYAKTRGAQPVCTVIGYKGLKMDPETTAHINALSAHVHDLDDQNLSSNAHTGCVILPAALAAGEEMNSSGKDVLEAFMCGTEVTAMIGRAVLPEHYDRGWHSTSTLGIFGSTAAAAKLYKLEKQQIMWALSMAASSSCGLQGNFGTMTKPLHAGNAAARAIQSVKLALLGWTANNSIMEAKRGFGNVTSGKMDEAAIDAYIEAGVSEFESPGMLFKLYPSCKGTHTAIDAIRELREEVGLKAEDVEDIFVTASQLRMDVCHYFHATSPTEAKFSLNYNIAIALVNGNVTLADFEPDVNFEDPAIVAVADRCRFEVREPEIVEGVASVGLGFGTKKWIMEVTTKDGKVYKKDLISAIGEPSKPANDEQMRGKLLACFGRTINNAAEVEILVDMVSNVADIESIRSLIELTDKAI